MHDVVVIGAGPGGSATASFLAADGLDVLLLDKTDFPRDKTCGDGLTPRALGVLDDLDVLNEVLQKGFRIQEAIVYSPKGTSVTTRVPQRESLPPYMLTIPRLVLDEIIRKQAVNCGVSFRGGIHVTGISCDANSVAINGRRRGKSFSAHGRIAVIAIGANVRLLLSLGILKSTPRMILASRTYYEGMNGLSGLFEFHFDGVPIPGYGWVFPLSDSSANIGAGVLPTGKRRERRRGTSKAALEQFLKLPRMREMLCGARRAGPIKGFPLRTDFATAPTYGDRVLLVGEAAGLVNPLTGEGVDFALESAKIAANHLASSFANGDLSRSNLKRYDRKLRARFQRVFVFSMRMRNWYMNDYLLNRLVYVAKRRDGLKELFTDVVLGNADAARAFSLRTLLQLIFTK